MKPASNDFARVFKYYGMMGKQLYREGKRKCYVCKEVKLLSFDNFYRSNRKNTRGFSFICKLCAFKVKKSPREKRILFIKKMGNKCQRCLLFNDDVRFFDLDHIVPILNRNRNPHISQTLIDSGAVQILCPNCHRIKTISERTMYNQHNKRGNLPS